MAKLALDHIQPHALARELEGMTAPASGGAGATLNRLDLSGGDPEQLDGAPLRYDGIDVGIDRAGHARLVYSRCDAPTACVLYSRSFTGPATPVLAATPGCKETRPSTWNGLVLFYRSGAACPGAGLWLTRAKIPEPNRIAGITHGADLAYGRLAWRAGDGQLVVMRVQPGSTATREGRLVPAGGQTFQPPLVVESGHLYFIHQQGSSHFIARVPLPLREPSIEHYSPGDEVGPAPEAPHFGVTSGMLYLTNYPRPGGQEGSRVIVRVDEPEFEVVGEEVATVVSPPD